MRSIPYPDQLHLDSAVGWMMLGDILEAAAEFRKISRPYDCNPDYILVQSRLLIESKEWYTALDFCRRLIRMAPERPQGWIHQAYCLHELNRTREAFRMLLPAARRFPSNHLIAFNLACYCCHLEQFDAALRWTNRALTLVDGDSNSLADRKLLQK